MESNKEDAWRAKQVAEKKFGECDLVGAKKFALKAQQMYPSLEGLSHLLAVLDVHAAAAAANDLPDWYAVLQVPSAADEAVIRKQYRRLALLLHPDKNKCVGAEEAFKLIGQACRLLSSPSTRAAYDHNRDRNAKRDSPSAFWTLCPSCNMRFQFHIQYINRYLICPNCSKPFMAIHIAAPAHMPPAPAPRCTKEEEEEEEEGRKKKKEEANKAKKEKGRRKKKKKEEEVKFDKSAFDRLFAGQPRRGQN